MTLGDPRRIERSIMAAAMVLAALVWLPWGIFGTETRASKTPAWVSAQDPLVVLGALATRPLLDATRGRRTGAVAGGVDGRDAATAMPVSKRYLLRGLARADDRDIAVVEDVTANRFVRLQRGQAVGDWYLSAVSTSDVTLKNQDGVEERLPLEAATLKKVISPASPPQSQARPAPSSANLPFGPVVRPTPPR